MKKKRIFFEFWHKGKKHKNRNREDVYTPKEASERVKSYAAI
tara:strand:+ start:4871 stop:4996 length:126 start_codon:yes stop_codon:yes gene_type:complete